MSTIELLAEIAILKEQLAALKKDARTVAEFAGICAPDYDYYDVKAAQIRILEATKGIEEVNHIADASKKGGE